MLAKSIIIAAHPDDEVLWFSSILEEVNEVVICFLEHASNPDYTKGRKKSLLEHPIKNICCLKIDEAGTFRAADWNNPVLTEFGIELSRNNTLGKKYRDNYYTLRQQLDKKLTGYLNVFTHNPWGEYGHEEHIQVYRVVRELQEKLKFNLWFSNYCSNSSCNLMLRYISGFDSAYVTLQTNKVKGTIVKDIYKKNGCWTWYDAWEWFNEESFMKDRQRMGGIETYGHIFPLNMIKWDPFAEAEENSRTKSNGDGPRNFISAAIKSFLDKRESTN